MSDDSETGMSPLPDKIMYEKLATWWDKWKVSLLFEKYHPVVGGVIAGTWTILASPTQESLKPVIDNVLPVATTVAAIFGSYQAVAQTVVLAIIDRDAVRILRRSGHYNRWVDYQWASIRILLWFIGISLWLLLHSASKTNSWGGPGAAAFLLALTATWAALSGIRIVRLMVKMLRVAGRIEVGDDAPPPGPDRDK